MSSKYRTYQIEKLHFRGDGLAVDVESGSRRRIHIANALPGETVVAVEPDLPENPDQNKGPRRRYACLIEVLHPSDARVDPVCPHWRRCPACQYLCVNAEVQQKIKYDNWVRLISRYMRLPERTDFLPAACRLGYRHRVDALVFRGTLGLAPRLDVQLLESENQKAPVIRPIPLRECVLHAPELNEWLLKVEQNLAVCGFGDGTPIGVEAFRCAGFEEQARITVYSMPEVAGRNRSGAEKLAEILGVSVIFQELPPKGSHVFPKPELFGASQWYGYDTDDFGEMLFAMKGAWTPVNPENAHLIRDTLKEMIAPYRYGSVLELGCGCGTHTPVFRGHADHYVGIDAAWPAILSAQHNAEKYDWKQVAFYTDTAEHYLDKRYYQGRRADCILMHSNRLPYSRKVAEYCMRFGAKHIFIVAPTAYAMAQECGHFTDLGYVPERLVICDTLPMTYHQMAVCHLEWRS